MAHVEDLTWRCLELRRIADEEGKLFKTIVLMWAVLGVILCSPSRDVVAVLLHHKITQRHAAASLPTTNTKPQSKVEEKLFQTSRPAMGTSFEIYLYAADREQATQLFDEAFEEIERLESLLSNYRDSSELSRINKRAAHEQVVTDPEMFHFLEQSLAWSRRTEGAFDITVGGLMRAWGFFRGRGKLPTDAELIAVRAHTGWRHVLLSHATRSIRFDAANVELDSGGIGKGYAVDAVAQILRVRDVRAALVVAGSSSIYAIGSPPGKSGWTINIPEPMNRARTIQPVLLQDKALTTSGSYEKFFRIGERTYCHIMDPRTGRPVEGILQTTIIAPTATEGEVLSKATFVLGAIDGKRLLETLGQNYAGLLVTDKQGAGRIVRIRL